MAHIVEPARRIPVIDSPEVLVVGAGAAGCAAAIAAARNGADVLLVERTGVLGGSLTAGFGPILGFQDATGRQVVRGIAEELVEDLVALRGSRGHLPDLTGVNVSRVTFDPEAMKMTLLDVCEKSGVRFLLHTLFADAQVAPGRITGVVVESKSGRAAIAPRVVVDCSGDADVAARAGAPVSSGRESDGARQPVSLRFRIGGVDDSALRVWLKANRALLTNAPTDDEIDVSPEISLRGLRALCQLTAARGEYPTEAAPRVVIHQLPRPGQVVVDAPRLQRVDGADPRDLTRAELSTRRQAWGVWRFLKGYVGGFRDSYIVDTGAAVEVRESRRIVGDYVLTESDVFGGREFPDGVACGAAAIEVQPPTGRGPDSVVPVPAAYAIPYRCLLPRGLDNLLVAGRPISATQAASGSLGALATCIALGQAAGTAAAIAAERDQTTREVSVTDLRAALVAQDQYLLEPLA